MIKTISTDTNTIDVEGIDPNILYDEMRKNLEKLVQSEIDLTMYEGIIDELLRQKL